MQDGCHHRKKINIESYREIDLTSNNIPRGVK
jgi:hypothetical protein